MAGAGNPDYGVRLWGPLGAQGLSHELNHPHKLLGKLVFFVRHCLYRAFIETGVLEPHNRDASHVS